MTARRAPTAAIDSFTQIATLRIELKDADPPIWRVVEVPTSITLKVLHDIVQVAMGWLDYHLWEMVIDGQTYGLPDGRGLGDAPRKVAEQVRLRDVIAPGTTTIDYTYDFGDSWEHKLIVSDVRPAIPAPHIPASSPGNATARPRTAAAFPASTRCSKPEPIPPIPITPKSASGSTATIPKNSTSSRSKSPSAASPPAATPQQSASSNRQTTDRCQRGLHRMATEGARDMARQKSQQPTPT